MSKLFLLLFVVSAGYLIGVAGLSANNPDLFLQLKQQYESEMGIGVLVSVFVFVSFLSVKSVKWFFSNSSI